MTTLVQWYGNGIPNGKAIAVGDSGNGDNLVSSVVGAAPTMDTTQAVSPVVDFVFDATNASYLQFNLSASHTASRSSVWFKTPSAWASSSGRVLDLADSTASGNRVAGLVVAGSGAPGQVRIHDNTGSYLAVSPNSTLALSTWYRAELIVDQANSRVKYIIYAADGVTVIYTQDWVTGTFGAGFDRVLVGQPTPGPAWNLSVGLLKITDTMDVPIEIPGSGSSTAGIYVFDGTEEIPLGSGSSPDAGTTIITAATGSSPVVPEGGVVIFYDYEPVVYAEDAFNRTVAAGSIGSADVGGSWTLTDNSSEVSVNPTDHMLFQQVAGHRITGFLPSLATTILDAEMTVDVSFDTPHGGNTAAHFALRRDAGGDLGYAAYIYRTSSGGFALLVDHATGTTIGQYGGSTPALGLATGYTGIVHVRLRVSGSNPTRIQAKFWADTISEPVAWAIDVTDSTASLQDAGGVAWTVGQSSSATDVSLTRVSSIKVTEIPPS